MLKILAEIGIMLLIFEIGFETDIGKLKDVGRESIVLAIGGTLDNEIYSTLVLVVVITTLLPPILLKYYFKADT